MSSTANTKQTITPIDRPVLRRSAVGGSMVWVDPASDIPGLLGPTSWGSHRADLRFRDLSALHRRIELILVVPGP